MLGYEEPVYRHFDNDGDSEGLYRKTFRAPRSLAGKRVLLRFGGVWASAEVWLNGCCLGRHDSGFTSFAFDVSGCIKAGEDNVLAVRVRQVYPGHETDTYDDWSLGGIYRDVTLESMPAKRRIDRVRVQTEMSGRVTVSAMVADANKSSLPGNYLGPGKPYSVRFTLLDAGGNLVAGRTVGSQAHPSQSREIREVLEVACPKLWSAETPYLYKLRVELLEDGKPAHAYEQKIGIREISTAGGVLRVNGVAVKLRGVNRHDEYPDVGRATRREHWLKDLTLMKQANINYVRACHYQHAKGFIEMCDSIGMYVGEEVSLGGAGQRLYDPAFAGPALLRTYETVSRDINNPSVIYWSVGNEDSFTDLSLQCVRTVKGLDHTRPVLLPWNAYDGLLPEDIDILAPHYWTAHQYDSLARASKRPVITTEYVHAYGLQRMGGLDDCFKALTCHPAGAGGAVWMWADQGLRTPVKKDPKKYALGKGDEYLRLNPAGWDGITDSYRNPTRDYWEVKAVYCPIDAWLKDGKIIIRNNYDFLNLNTCSIHWQTFTLGKQKAEGTVVLNANPHSEVALDIKAKDADYVWLTFVNEKGWEIGKRSLELKRHEIANCKTGLAVDPSTGLPKGIRPTIWHRLNDGDEIIKNRKFDGNADPEKYTCKVLSIKTEGNVTRSSVAYKIDDNNGFEASYVCTNSEKGLSIDYSITPNLQTNYVPIVGLAFKMSSARSLKRWYGLGPDEAYPNKKAAEILGLWDARNMSGTRAMQWVDFDNVRVYSDGYLDRDGVDSQEIRVLSNVLGRSEKGRLNDKRYQLPTGRTYSGSVIVQKK